MSGFISSPVLFTANPGWLFSGGVDCGHPCAVRRIPVLDAWIARVSREEREALEARQQAMMEGQQEGGHVSH